MRKGDRVIVDTSSWSEQGRQRAKVERIGELSIGLVWETGELAGKEANVARSHLVVTEVLK